MTETVLIVDDSEDDQLLYRRALKDFDYELIPALSAEAGFAHLSQSKRPDLILLDYNLLDMDGLSFMKRLAEYSATPIPIIMLTGESNAAVAVEVMKHGADDYLVKDTEGRYLKQLPGVVGRVIAAHAQREQTKRLRQETEALLLRNQALMQNSKDGIHIMDMHGNLVEANDAFCHMLGYTQEEMARLNVADWDAQWSAEELREGFKELIGKNARFETVHRRKDGSLINVEVSTSGKEIEGQYFLFAASHDITERKEAEDALRVAAVAFETRDAIVITDARANIIRVNQAFSDITGYSSAEVLGRNPGMMRSGRHDKSFFIDMWLQLLHTGSWAGEIWDKRKNGQIYPKWLTITTVKNDRQEITRYVGIFSDIFLRVNQKLCEITGYSHDELIRMGFQEIIFSADQDKVDYVRQVLEGDMSTLVMEKRYVRKDQTLVWVNLTVSPLRNADGTPKYFIGVIEDITERKRAEQQMRDLSLHLQTVREEEKASIAREIHDDLGGTLVALKMDAYWLASKLAAKKGMEPLQESAKSMIGLLDTAVMSTRRLITELRPTLLDDQGLVVALKWQGPQFHKRTGIECSVVCIEDEGCESKLDKTVSINLFRIFQEALTNVARHSGASRVEVELHQGDEEVVLSVSDNGCGLPQGHSIAPTSYGMLGMRERVEQLGGKIEFGTPSGGGFCVTVKLPYLPTMKNESDSLRAEAVTQLVRARVTDAPARSAEELLYELRVHQIELEMQNEELRRAQVVIEESRDRYADIYEFAPVGYFTLTRTGQISEINLTGASLLGVDRNKLLQHRFDHFISPEDRDRWHRLFVSVMENAEKMGIELALQRGDGSTFYAHLDCLRTEAVTAAPLLRMALTDISAMQLNKQLHEAQDSEHQILHETKTLLLRYQTLLQNSMEGIHIMDIEGNVIEVNDAFCNMLGYIREETLRLNVADWNAQWSREELHERFKANIGNSVLFETVYRHKEGMLIHVEIISCGIEIDGKAYLYAASRDITERKVAEQALRESEERWHFAIDGSGDGVWDWNLETGRIVFSERYLEMLGYAGNVNWDCLDDWKNHVAAEEMQQAMVMLEAYLDGKIPTYSTEYRMQRADGGWAWILARGKVVSRAVDGRPLRMIGTHTDITERKQTEEALRVAAVAFETHDAILITDARANIIRVNQAFTDITGYSLEEVLGHNPRIMSSGRQDKVFYIEMWQQLLHTGSWAGEIWDKRKNGQIYPKWLTITAVKNERYEATHYVAIFSDITARKQAEDEIRNLAFYDSLTRLPNRRLFMDRFRAALTISTRRNDYGAVLFIDLDRFKTLNDTLGHDYGDLLLIEVAARIKSCVREMDTVARLGGDEFVVLIEGINEDQDETSRKVGLIAENIRETLAHPYKLKSHEHHSSPSIGISLYRGNENSVDELLQQADMAMYQAKNSGRNAVRFFDPVMQHNVASRAALENDLHHAIALGQLQLHYQVQVDSGHRPLGAEALLRWFHPQRGLVMPGDFISIAEESSLILDIGHWVLDQAGGQLALWAGDERMRDLTLAVNVSAKQFAQPGFVGQIADVVRSHRIVPSSLKLELTESMVLHDLKSTIDKMHALKRLGVKLSMDDFGTGYSSLSYLRDLPLDQIKIDQSFIQNITRDGNDALLVQTIIDLGGNFRMNVIAEGVETEAQLTFLKHHDCMNYQGFLFSKPVPIEEFEKLLGGT